MRGINVSIPCPYCGKKLSGVKSVYGHWATCAAYKSYVKKNGKERRIPFRWTGYTKRRPKGWVNRTAAQKPMAKPEVKKPEVKKS